MKNKFLFLVSEIWRGKSVTRSLMNYEFKNIHLDGHVLDVGGGRNPDYFKHAKTDTLSQVIAIDMSMQNIDFEKDKLPFENNTADTIICCNVLEHIYNHKFLVSEIERVLKSDGSLVGFVPFLINYHPDPHDYFRYTKEALKNIFEESRLVEIAIRPVGGGPFLVNCNNLILSIPKILRVPFFIFYAVLDFAFLKFRPKVRDRFPLGYLFTAKKCSI